MTRGVKGTTENTRHVLRVEISQQDLDLLNEWASKAFRKAEGHAAYLLHQLVEQRKNGTLGSGTTKALEFEGK